MHQPLKWHGGKSYLAGIIIEMMPEHTHYCEPFAGGLSVLLRKAPEGISEAVNDLDEELVSFWEVLACDIRFPLFKRAVEAVPMSQEHFKASFLLEQRKHTYHPRIARALRFFVQCRQSRQGLRKDYATPTKRTRRGMNENVSAWLTAVDGLQDVHARLRRVEIRRLAALDFIRKYDHKNVLFYCDPPYLHETRVTTADYTYEMSPEEHEQLLVCLSGIAGRFILSGYPSDLYHRYADNFGWRCTRIQIDNKASGQKTKPKKTECLWTNY